MSSSIPSASHPATNKAIFDLITARIEPDSKVLDFGAGSGHMAERLGKWFAGKGKVPAEQIFAFEVAPEGFRYAEITCRQIGFDSLIPCDDEQFDIVYAIEVMEHMARPYDFMKEAFRALKPGGTVIFSVPNILHMDARLSFLFSGFPVMFGPPSTADKNAGRICGHIMPLGYPYFCYGLKRAGFGDIQVYPDRIKRGARAWSTLLYPFLRLGTGSYLKRLKRYDPEVFEENRHIVSKVNEKVLLTSRSCIMVGKKA